MAPFTSDPGLFYGLMGDCLYLGVLCTELTLQRPGRNKMTDFTLRGAFVKIDSGPLSKADFLHRRFANRYVFDDGFLQVGFFQLQVTQVANVFWNLEMLFRRHLKVAGIASQLLPLERLFAEMGFVFESYILGILNFLVLKFSTVMTARLQAGAVLDNRSNGKWRIGIIQVGGQMTQAFHFSLKTVFFTGQEMTINAFCLDAIFALAGMMIIIFPGGELLGHCVAGPAAEF